MTATWDIALTRPRRSTESGLHVWSIAVSSYQNREEIYAAKSTLAELGDFWRKVARGHSYHLPQGDVLSVRTLEVGQGCSRKILLELIETAIDADDIREGDTFCLYWMGHGEAIGDNERLLLMPLLEDPKHEATREAFWLQDLARYFGRLCRASKQVFFLDCCSIETKRKDDGLPQRWPMLPSKVAGTYMKRQRIFVGSGFGFPAISSSSMDRSKPSLFAWALMQSLKHFAANKDGHIGNPKRLLESMASLIANEWLKRGYGSFPRDIPHMMPFWNRFVSEVVPSNEYRAHYDPVSLGRSDSPMIHFLLGAVISAKRRNIELLNSISAKEIPLVSMMACDLLPNLPSFISRVRSGFGPCWGGLQIRSA
jgi:hypothetical protein